MSTWARPPEAFRGSRVGTTAHAVGKELFVLTNGAHQRLHVRGGPTEPMERPRCGPDVTADPVPVAAPPPTATALPTSARPPPPPPPSGAAPTGSTPALIGPSFSAALDTEPSRHAPTHDTSRPIRDITSPPRLGATAHCRGSGSHCGPSCYHHWQPHERGQQTTHAGTLIHCTCAGTQRTPSVANRHTPRAFG